MAGRTLAVLQAISQSVAAIDDGLGTFKDRAAEYERRMAAGIVTDQDFIDHGISKEMIEGAMAVFVSVYGKMTPEEQAAFQLARK